MSHRKSLPVEKPSVEVSPIDPAQASFTIPQVATYSGLTRWQVRMAIWEGRLPAKRVGRSLIILRADVDSFLKSLPSVGVNDAAWLIRRKRSPIVVRA